MTSGIGKQTDGRQNERGDTITVAEAIELTRSLGLGHGEGVAAQTVRDAVRRGKIVGQYEDVPASDRLVLRLDRASVEAYFRRTGGRRGKPKSAAKSTDV